MTYSTMKTKALTLVHYVVFDGTSAFICGEDDLTSELEILFKSNSLEDADTFLDSYIY